MNRLSGLDLRGFKSIREVSANDLRLGPLNILIGANGAGKSNFISFFRLLSAMARGEFQTYVALKGGASSFLFDGPARTTEITAQLTFEDPGGSYEYACTWQHAAQDTFVFAGESIRLANAPERTHQLTVRWSVGHRETALLDPTQPLAGTTLEILKQCVVYHFHDTSDTARVRQRWSTSDSLQLKEDAANLAPFLLRLRDQAPAAYARIRDAVRQIAPFFSDFELQPEGNSALLRWREKGSDVLFGPHQVSDGTLRAMALLSLLLQPEDDLPAILILDEPELGLHPYAIEVVAGLLRAVSHHTQVIVATQSTVLLDHFQPGEIIVVDRVGRESKFKRLDEAELKDWLKEYALAELWEKNVLGGTPG